MLYGRTPFRGKNRQKTFSNILNKDLTFPSSIPVSKCKIFLMFPLTEKICKQIPVLTIVTVYLKQVSLEARQLINALLQRDPADRIGANTGANEIKQHPFFQGINWPLIRHMVTSMINFISTPLHVEVLKLFIVLYV